jgi:single-stranded-DNA-specific exonuclease
MPTTMIYDRKKWLILEPNRDTVAAIASARPELGPVLPRLLANRGISGPGEAADFLRPDVSLLHDPFLLRDMARGVETVLTAIRDGRRIAIYGDYDVDGITATALLVDFLRTLTPRVEYFIPERLQDGYGLRTEHLDALRNRGVDLVVTVDCGISSGEEVAAGRRRGLDFVVTDHHHISGPLPDGISVINPRHPECAYPNRDLAGAGVAFKLVQGLRLRLAAENAGAGALAHDSLIELAAIGSIGDVVPLRGENRALVSLGLEALQKSTRPGLIALKTVAGIREAVRSSSVAYYLAPRLNASGRLGKADRSVELFLATDPTLAGALAAELDRENQSRQQLESNILSEVRRRLEHSPPHGDEPIVLEDASWHPGVIGVVAARLVDLYRRPAALLAAEGDLWKGSIRSIPGRPLPALLEACAGHLESFGGHTLASGFTVHRDRYEGFRRCFLDLASRPGSVPPEPSLEIDMDVPLLDLNRKMVEKLSALEPFGHGNPAPLFLARGVTVIREPEVFSERHLRLHLSQGGKILRAIGFRLGALAEDILQGSRLDVVYTPELRQSRGVTEISLVLRDFSPAGRVDHDG